MSDSAAPDTAALAAWLAANPPARPTSAAAPFLVQLAELRAQGYTWQQLSDWLALQGVEVSRQALTKFCLRQRATPAQPLSNPDATRKQPRCNPRKPNPIGVPAAAHAEHATLKARAQAVGEQYLNNTLSPLAVQLLSKNRKT